MGGKGKEKMVFLENMAFLVKMDFLEKEKGKERSEAFSLLQKGKP